MKPRGFVVITDRGGHLHDALRLLDQMQVAPEALVTTTGPDVRALKANGFISPILSIPQSFSWIGKTRIFNPFLFAIQLYLSLAYAIRLRPKSVVSTGAGNVVLFCYFSWMLGARIYHVDNLAQVTHASIAGKLLYPIATALLS